MTFCQQHKSADFSQSSTAEEDDVGYGSFAATYSALDSHVKDWVDENISKLRFLHKNKVPLDDVIKLDKDQRN